jgi:phosphoenolpyruvate carboxykinase (ATP)
MADPRNDARVLLELLRSQIESNLTSSEPQQRMAKQDLFDLGSFQSRKAFENEMADIRLNARNILHNASPARLYEEALRGEKGTFITNTGALAVTSGAKTGRCPGDKRIVDEPVGWWAFTNEVWWGKVNIKLSDESFLTNRERAIDYLNTQDQLYVVDAFAGWDKEHRIRVRVICCRAYHALFMQNMLVMPTKEEMQNFKPDFVIYNAGKFPCNRYTSGMTSSASVALHFRRGEMVILGTEYAGEMKKGILTLMMYAMPKKNLLPLHSSANLGPGGDVTMFFGLSGTGKTTLSADPNRKLIGDDEHVWSDTGVFNVEGGCYAKAIDLDPEKEPEIFSAIRFGAVVENVVFDEETREVDYTDTSITENTRAAYPLHYIPNAQVPAIVDQHPSNIILLTCDAFGVLPPVAKLTPAQVQYYFIQGYTAKVAGTEVGVTEPTATFSACFGAPFLVWHPIIYAEMLAKKLQDHECDAWLLNTGWTGGAYGTGQRISIKHTRKIVDAIHSGELAAAEYDTMPLFNLEVPTHIAGVPDDVLMPRNAWADKAQYDTQILKLAKLFKNNMMEYADRCPYEVKAAGPFLKVPSD